MPLSKRVIRPDCVRLFDPFFPAVLFSDTCFFSSAAFVKFFRFWLFYFPFNITFPPFAPRFQFTNLKFWTFSDFNITFLLLRPTFKFQILISWTFMDFLTI